MVRAHMRLPGFCMNHATVRVRARSPSQQYKQTYNSNCTHDKSGVSSNSIEIKFNGVDMLNPKSAEGGNRVMVVVDSSLEAKAALQWALSHTVQSQDTIVLLHVTKPSKQGANSNRRRAYQLLCSMKDACQMKRPWVHVDIAQVEGNGKGPTIVEEAKQQRVSLLVLGRRKQSMICRIHTLCTGKRTRNKVADYCIQYANCMTITVRRNNRKCGGYLITTKRHKNFWLLA